jgi:hypothetical protein
LQGASVVENKIFRVMLPKLSKKWSGKYIKCTEMQPAIIKSNGIWVGEPEMLGL